MVGIDRIGMYIPEFYLPLSSMAEKRGIAYEKLSKGLGLESAAIPGTNEDAVTMAAAAALDVLKDSGIHPSQIGRIYVGSESNIDGAKPIASYVLGILESWFTDSYGENSLRNCDAVDMTFACIGATDALLNTLDWCHAHPEQVGIVIATDYARYELGSGGEYTQGAGAVALLVKSNPRLLEIDSQHIGVACKDEHDFHKPVRSIGKENLVREILSQLGITQLPSKEMIDQIAIENVWVAGEQEVEIHTNTPLFDGQFSNNCYADRLREAYLHYGRQTGENFKNWQRLVFHLPYAQHGKRIFPEIFGMENPELLTAYTEEKALAKSPEYTSFSARAIESGQIISSQVGNLYTASVFMALLSTLTEAKKKQDLLPGDKLGFCCYGSGSKAKVFRGTLVQNWENQVDETSVAHALATRTAISFEEYEHIHRKSKKVTSAKAPVYLAAYEAPLYQRKYELNLNAITSYRMAETAVPVN